MGGDGGVIASSRKFMRGAGTADCVGDIHKHAAHKFNAKEAMSTCALTKTPLHSTSGTTATIVSDPYGHLYHKEAAIQALLKRKQQVANDNESTIGPQVRRLADLYDVRFHRDDPSDTKNTTPTCPISGKALNGSIPAVVLVPGKKGLPNVVTESTLSQLTSEELEAEFGAILKKVRLAPNPVLLEQIKGEVRREQEQEDEERRRVKMEKKKDKKNSKRKRKEKNDRSSEKKNKIDGDSSHQHAPLPKSSNSFGQKVQSRVDSAIQQSSVLSSLFTNKRASSKISEKEKKDNLFAR
mmetsp:Transcript_9890/g.23866  ORF Transcript_9890/g.23866 Transcript_9890/m.23866 type:complete len:296 (+) Transcript_9890:198-1085(+)|eukprot:CAMPEP_0172397120 /NCGR_PEP_ID=MMETSP1061-20121228/29137_1 /TAXON_ID=37318 /ORGANISM="Pseudo-nitzschia pungens, Strain cf. pungens" /LENGTH=295 /DNA_ID=CAMNT_0013129201 /DNA_START=156 /DNA_END=1043 /DNA_ORIENTATION=+